MRIFILIISLFVWKEVFASFWTDLWRTPDQQGQIFMQKGNYAKAKEKFENQQWSATANYRAGDYEEAAKQYEALQSEEGYYNQGNALAHLGQYEKAIAAYDKALSFNPNHQDALYNRQLLKDLMKKDKEKKQNQDQQAQNQKNKDSDKDKQQNKDKQDNQSQEKQDKNNQNKNQQNQDKQEKDKQEKDKKQENKDKNKQKEQNEKQDKDNQNKDNQDKNKKDKEQPKPQPSDKQQTADKEKGKANQQWLQLVPDDPGGLLREKFLRDHLRRERGWTQ